MALVLIEVSVNAVIFYAWVEQELTPELPKKSVNVMDNATFHKRQDIQQILKKEGCEILWLRPYGPDFNPIEEVWSWIKAARK